MDKRFSGLLFFWMVMAIGISACHTQPGISEADESDSVETLQSLSGAIAAFEPGVCCGSSPDSGCVSAECEACVCNEDAFCCDTSWDSNCVAIGGSDCRQDCGCANGCADPPGDVNLSSLTNILDIMCVIVGALVTSDNPIYVPECAGGDLSVLDINCDGNVNVIDVQAMISLVLGDPLSSQIDANGDNCPDACAFGVDDVCAAEDSDGLWCDDGSRCTTVDTCVDGVCKGIHPLNCDDGNECTTDVCNDAVGCASFPNTLPCEEPAGSGVCFDGICQISECEESFYDLNLIAADGCEYECVPIPGGLDFCNNTDDNCNGAIDESCGGDCSQSELPDDGFDSDCDGKEWIGDSNILVYIGKLDPEGGPIEVGLGGLFQMGPFGEIPVAGEMSRGIQDGPVTWCVTGDAQNIETPSALLEESTNTACLDVAGNIEGFFDAELTWEDKPVSATGLFTLGETWSMEISFTDVTLKPGLVLEDVTLVQQEEDDQSTMNARLLVGIGATQAWFDITGQYATEGDLSLSLSLAPNTVWTPYPGFPLQMDQATGSLNRVNGQWDVSILSSTDNVDLSPGPALEDVTVEANAPGLGDWALTLTGATDTGPFGSVPMTGTVDMDESGNFSACFVGTTVEETHGLIFDPLEIEMCFTPEGTNPLAVAGKVQIEDTPLSFSGTLVDETPWSMVLNLPHFPVGPGLVLDDAIITLTESDPTLPLIATLVLGAGVEAGSFHVDALYPPGQDFSFPLSLKAGTTWRPFANLDMEFLSVNGQMDKTGGVTSASVSSSLGSPFPITPAFTLSTVSVTGTVDEQGIYTATLDGAASLGPFGIVPASGALVAGDDMCFGAFKTVNLDLVTLFDVLVQACVDTSGNIITTLEGLLILEGNMHPFTGLMDLESPWAIKLELDELDLGNNHMAKDVVLTLQEGAEDIDVEGVITVNSGEQNLTLALSGKMVPGEDYSLDLSLPEGATWDPFPALGLVVTDISGTLKRVNGVTTLSFESTDDFGLTVANGVPMSGAHVDGWTDTAGVFHVSLVGTVDLGPLGVQELSDTLEGNQVDLDGCFSVESVVSLGSILVQNATIELCLNATNATLEGIAEIEGTVQAVSGILTFDPWLVELTLGDLPLGAGVVLKDTVVTYAEGSDFLDLVANTTVGDVPASLSLDVAGIYKNNGNADLAATLSANSFWSPEPTLALSIDEAVGTVKRTAGIVEVEMIGLSDESIDVAPGLGFTSTEALGFMNDFVPWTVLLTVTAAIPMGEDIATPTLYTEIDGSGLLMLTGSQSGSVEPLITTLGPEKGILMDPEFVILAIPGFYSEITLISVIQLCFQTQLCLLTEYGYSLVDGTIIDGEVALSGFLPVASVPSFGAVVGGTFLMNSDPQNGYDIWGTPSPADDVDAPVGVTLAAYVDSPVPVIPNEPPLPFVFSLVSATQIDFSADHGFNWTLFGPGDIPSINSLSINDLLITGNVIGTKLSLFFHGLSTLFPVNNIALTGPATVEVTDSGQLGSTLDVTGQWIEPMGLSDLAVEDPTLHFLLDMDGLLPSPLSFSLSENFYWLKDGGAWPTGAFSSSNQLVTVDGLFQFETTSSASQLCTQAFCTPTEPTLLQLESGGLTTEESVSLMNTARSSLVDVFGFGDTLPSGSLGVPAVDPLVMTSDLLTITFASHHRETLGITWRPGFHVRSIGGIEGGSMVLDGVMDADGLELSGEGEFFSILGSSLVNNPHQREGLFPGQSQAEINNANAMNLQTGTLEAWVQSVEWTTNAPFIDKVHGGNGYRLMVGDPQNGVGRILFESYNGNATLTVTSDNAVVEPGTRQHIAATFDGTTIHLFHQGQRIASTATGSAIPAGSNNGPLVLGKGVDTMDDVRVWTVVRTTAEIAGARHILRDDEKTGLLARYGFDYDPLGQGVYNWQPATPTLHGEYQNGADSGPTVGGPHVALRISHPVFNTNQAGLHLESGLLLDLPVLSPTSMKTQLSVGNGQAGGNIYAQNVTLMSLNGIGSLQLAGQGPNGILEDFDDGFYPEVDLYGFSLFGADGFSFVDNDGNETPAGEALLDLTCPGGGFCGNDTLTAAGNIQWTAPLPNGIDTMSFAGTGTYSSATNTLNGDGTLSVFGLDLLSSNIVISSSESVLTAPLSLSALTDVDLGSLEIPLTFQHSPALLCGAGAGPLSVPGIDGAFQADVDLCTGASESFFFDANANQVELAGLVLTDAALKYNEEDGVMLSGHIDIPNVFNGYVEGPFQAPDDFSLTTLTTVNIQDFQVQNALLEISQNGISLLGDLVMGDVGLLPISGTIEVTGEANLVGSGTLQIEDFSLPTEVEIDENGVSLTGDVSLPPLNAQVTGSATAPGNLVLTGSTLLIFSASGGTWFLPDTSISILACIDSSGPCVGTTPLPSEQARVSGTLEIFDTNVAMIGQIADPLILEGGPADLDVDGYALTDTSLSLSIAGGMEAAGTIGLPEGSAIVSGKIALDGDSTLEGGKNLSILTDPALVGDVNLVIPAQSDTYVGGNANLAHESVALSDATWTMTADGVVSFNGVRPSSVDLGTICEPDPATEECETCSEVVCTQTCWSPFGVYCCASTVEEWSCNCTVSDYCAEIGTIGCDVEITGGTNGLSDDFGATCTQGGAPDFETTIPASSGEVCVDGGGPVGTQCGSLW